MGLMRIGSCWRKAKTNEEGEKRREVGDKVGVPWRPDSGPDGGLPSGRTFLWLILLVPPPLYHNGDKNQGRSADHLS